MPRETVQWLIALPLAAVLAASISCVPADARPDVCTELPAPDAVRLFGLGADAQGIVFLVEGGGSYTESDLMHVVRTEPTDSIRRLPESSRFGVVFFSKRPRGFRDGGLVSAGRREKADAIAFVREVGAVGEQPEIGPAWQSSVDRLARLPEEQGKVLYLVCYGELTLPAEQLREIGRICRTHGIRIYAVLLHHAEPPTGELFALARETDGRFMYIPRR